MDQYEIAFQPSVEKDLRKLSSENRDRVLARIIGDRALALAIELRIPLVEECEELKQKLEEEHNGKEH